MTTPAEQDHNTSSIQDMSFEKALGELESIVRGLERGETSLEHSIKSYERGVALKNHCETKLREAQTKIEKITVKADGSIAVEQLDDQEG